MLVSRAISLFQTFFSTAIASSSPNVTYSVVSLVPSNTTVGVIIDNQVYPLTTISDDSTLLHSGEAPVSASYQYALLLKGDHSIIETESFTRNGAKQDTLNEYYGRSWNSRPIDKIPAILPPLPIVNRIKSDLHIAGEIPTIHFMGNQTEIDFMHNNQRTDIDVHLKMTYISPNIVKSFPNITIGISGHSTRSLEKLSYKLNIPKGEDLFSYRRFKLRSLATDASYIRDELAYGIAESVGIPATGYSFARLYINNQPIGLFGLAEMLKNPWIRNEFANGSKKFKQGALYVADLSGGRELLKNKGPGGPGGPGDHARVSVSDLSYLGNNVTHYSLGQYSLRENPSKGTANYTRIMDLTKFISEQSTTKSDDSAVAFWKEKMDTDSFLRGLAHEVVISNSDGYFTMTNNYVLYDDLKHKRIFFTGQDFDLSLGHTIFNHTLMNGGNYTEFPYFLARPLMPRMLQVPQFKKEFEALIVKMTKDLVNLDVLGKRIDQLASMLIEDVAWDKTCVRMGKMAPRKMMVESNESGKKTYEYYQDSDVAITSFLDGIDFLTAVNGPTNISSNLGVKEWFALRSANILNFFDQ